MENSAPTATSSNHILITAALLTLLGDYLLWPAEPRLSLAIFALTACAALLLNRHRESCTLATGTALALFLAAAIQTVIEISFSNLLVLGALLLFLVGETSFPSLRRGWARWSEAAWNFVIVPVRLLRSAKAARRVPVDVGTIARRVRALCSILLPALLLGGMFVILLGNGNAIFAHWSADVFDRLWRELPDLSPGRIMLWLLLAAFAQALLLPAAPPDQPRWWTRAIPALSAPRDLRLARWRSLAILVVLNALFFAANTIDATYLWIHAQLPSGVSFSQFVPQGVYSLIAAVLLSALVLVAVFQQSAGVAAGKLLKALSLAWIAQNVALIASVLLRLKLYVDAYQLSELRIYVGFFLLLVAAGFALLAVHVVRRQSLNRLLVANALAVSALFFVVQFLDVAKWVADYNVTRWLDPHRALDIAYLASLGPPAYPALMLAAETPGRAEAHAAFEYTQLLKTTERAWLSNLNWRSVQTRRIRHARELVAHEICTRRP